MLNDFTGADKVYIACGCTDLRKGIDGLARLVQQQFALDPFANTLFLFCGRRRDRIKGLYWEKDGFILLYKRLEQGAYQWPRSESEVEAVQKEAVRPFFRAGGADGHGAAEFYLQRSGSYVSGTNAAAEKPVAVKAHERKRQSGNVLDVVPEGARTEVVEHRLPENERICSACGSELVEIGKDVRRTLQMKPAEFWIREDVYYTYACKNCEKETGEANIVKAAKEPALLPGSFASAEAVAYLAAQKFVMYSPLYRLEQEKPVLDALLSWANEMQAKTAPKSALGKAIHYLLEQWPYLTRYLEDGRPELSNNRAERSIKPFVMGRKNWLFANTPGGAQASSVIYSLIETAKENGLDSYRYLLWLLQNAPQLSETNKAWAESLLPANAPEECHMPHK